MSQAIGAQGIDLNQPAPFMGYDESILSREGLMQEPVAGGEINYPWLIAISSAMGNAMTKAIGMNTQVNFEPEWGFDCVGVGAGRYTGSGGRQSIGGATIYW